MLYFLTYQLRKNFYYYVEDMQTFLAYQIGNEIMKAEIKLKKVML